MSGNNGHPVSNTAGKSDDEHTFIYTSSAISQHPEIALTQDGLILIALLRGGDYDSSGLPNCGPNVAHALARCGFGESLLRAARTLSRERLEVFLDGWRAEVRQELRTNARGFLNSRKAKLADSIDASFPDIDTLMLYARPVTSELSITNTSLPTYRWDKEPDLGKLGALCERKFEWGTREVIVKRFRTVIWEPAVQRILRRAVLDLDAKEGRPGTPTGSHSRRAAPGSPSKRMIARNFSSQPHHRSNASDSDTSMHDAEEREGQLIVSIKSKRCHASMDGIEEYRLEVDPRQLVRLTQAGIQGLRVAIPGQQSSASPAPGEDEEMAIDDGGDDSEESEGGGGGKKRKKGATKERAPPDPDSMMRVWMPVCMVGRVEPGMCATFEEGVDRKKLEKEMKEARKASGNGKAKTNGRTRCTGSGKGRGAKGAAKKKAAVSERMRSVDEEDEEELSAEEDFSDVFGLKSKPLRATKSTSKSRLKTVLEDSDDFEEDKDETRPLMLSSSLVRPSSPSKTKPKAGAGRNTTPTPFAEATNENGRIDGWMKAAKPRTGLTISSSASKPATLGGKEEERQDRKRRGVLEALAAASLSASSTSSGSNSNSRAGSAAAGKTQNQRAPRPFPMAFHPLEAARERSASAATSSSSTSTAAATKITTEARRVQVLEVGNDEDKIQTTIINQRGVSAGARTKAKAKADFIEISSSSESESDTDGDSNGGGGNGELGNDLRDDPNPRQDLLLSLSSSPPLNAHLPASRYSAPASPHVLRTAVPIINLASSPAPSQPPSRAQAPACLDSVFKASKPRRDLSASSSTSTRTKANGGANGKPKLKPLPMVKAKVRATATLRAVEIREEDVIEID